VVETTALSSGNPEGLEGRRRGRGRGESVTVVKTTALSSENPEGLEVKALTAQMSSPNYRFVF